MKSDILPYSNESDLIFSNNLNDVSSGKFDQFIVHILCLAGNGNFQMAGKTFHIKEGDVVIWTQGKLVSEIKVSADFRVTALYVSNQFTRKYAPNNNYDIIGNLSLLQNPVLPLTEREKAICKNDLQQIRERMEEVSHRFRNELLGCLVVAFFLDLYDIHARINEKVAISEQSATLLRRFIALLSSGEYKNNRDVAYYASRLHVTPKYLSEICKKASGYPATYWIDRFTITKITQMLRNKEYTLTEIADQLNFSSISYFSRYVQRMLGTSPSEYRQHLEKVDMESLDKEILLHE